MFETTNQLSIETHGNPPLIKKPPLIDSPKPRLFSHFVMVSVPAKHGLC